MRLALNHVTRMGYPRICIAGVDLETGEHVRPTTSRNDLLTRKLLRENGGLVGVGTVVDIGHPVATGHPPDLEDHYIAAASIRYVTDLEPAAYLEIRETLGVPTLREAFGGALKAMDNDKWAIELGEGSGSLAVLKSSAPFSLEVDGWGKARVWLTDDEDAFADASLADVRFYEDNNKSVRLDRISGVEERVAQGVQAYVMLGLSRPFVGGADREMHWLQVNGICLVDRPVGDNP